MKLNPHKPDIAVQAQRQNLDWSIKSYVNHCSNSRLILGYNFGASSTFSFDEALLLCQISESEWVGGFPIMVKQC